VRHLRQELPPLIPGGDRPPDPTARATRRQVAIDGSGLGVAVFAFGVIYGLAARQAGLSLVEAMAMSVFVLAGASQFAAAGFIAAGMGWPAIIVLTALLNARHLLYGASLAPWLRLRPRRERAAAAYVLTDETFALSVTAFQRLGRVDMPIYWLSAALIVVPWIIATAAGYLGGQAVPDPNRLGLDVVFPAAFAGLTVGLITGRRELAAAAAGAVIAIVVSLATETSVGIVAGGLAGSAIGLAIPAAPPRPMALTAGAAGARGPADPSADPPAASAPRAAERPTPPPGSGAP
jgi:4-azaleucine resistance transporter AzlC